MSILHRQKFPKFLIFTFFLWLTNFSSWGQKVSISTSDKVQGSETGKIQISNAEQFKMFCEAVNNNLYYVSTIVPGKNQQIITSAKAESANVTLSADIDLGTNWGPVGRREKNKLSRLSKLYAFKGTFNGNGKTITCSQTLTEKKDTVFALFRFIKDATIINLTVNANFDVQDSAAAICGVAYGNSNIENCAVNGSVYSNEVFAGICVVNKGTITGCTNNADLCKSSLNSSSYAIAGGGIACNNTGTITKCVNNKGVYATSFAGGIVANASGTVSYCQNASKVKVVKVRSNSLAYAGGIVGKGEDITISSCFFSGSIESDSNLGSICASISGTSENNVSIREYGTVNYDVVALAQVKQGCATFKLNGNSSENPVWRQTIGEDTYPAINETSSIVYGLYSHGSNEIDVYSNDPNNGHITANSESAHDDKYEYNGGKLVCTACGKSITPESSQFPVQIGDYYVIFNENQLQSFCRGVNQGSNIKYGEGKKIRLANHIQLTSEFTPIGTIDYPFKGEFDGFGYSIKSLDVKADNNYCGLFGYANKTSYIHNLTVLCKDESITDYHDYIGYVCGYSEGKISDCNVTQGKIDAPKSKYVGGVAGWAADISNCTSNISVSGNNYVGGIAGHAGNINNCVYEKLLGAIGVQGACNVGGVVGSCSNSLANCRTAGVSVVAKDGNLESFGVGGIAGKVTGNSIENCYTLDVNVKSLGRNNYGNLNCYAGGIVGLCSAVKMEHCEVRGEGYSNIDEYGNLLPSVENYNSIISCMGITSSGNAGGLIGKVQNSIDITNSAVIKTDISKCGHCLVGTIGNSDGKLVTAVAGRYVVYDVTKIDSDEKVTYNNNLSKWKFVGLGKYELLGDGILFDNDYTEDWGYAVICLNDGVVSSNTTWSMKDNKYPVLRQANDNTVVYKYYDHGTDNYNRGGTSPSNNHIVTNTEGNHSQYLEITSTDHHCTKCGEVMLDNVLYHADGTSELCSDLKKRTGNDLVFVHGDVDDSYVNCVNKDGGDYSVKYFSLVEESDFATPVAFTAKNLHYQGKAKNKWSTLCLPFNFTKENVDARYSNVTESFDVQLYRISSVDDGFLTLQQVVEAEAGVPVLLYVRDDVARESYYVVEVNVPEANAYIQTDINTSKNGLYGVFKKKTITETGKEFYLKDNSFVKVENNQTFFVNPFHAYLIDSNASSSLSSFRIGDGADSVVDEAVVELKDKSIDAIYNLSGQRLGQMPAKGIFILRFTDGTCIKVNLVK